MVTKDVNAKEVGILTEFSLFYFGKVPVIVGYSNEMKSTMEPIADRSKFDSRLN